MKPLPHSSVVDRLLANTPIFNPNAKLGGSQHVTDARYPPMMDYHKWGHGFATWDRTLEPGGLVDPLILRQRALEDATWSQPLPGEPDYQERQGGRLPGKGHVDPQWNQPEMQLPPPGPHIPYPPPGGGRKTPDQPDNKKPKIDPKRKTGLKTYSNQVK